MLYVATLAGNAARREVNAMRPAASPSRTACVVFVSLLVASCAAFGQPAHKRLSDWLLEQPQSPDTYPLGLSWRVPEETVSQTALFLELLKNLSSADLEATVNPAAVRRMRDWVGTMRVTGRVPVAVVDARWLQGNPARDPVLRAGQTVILPKRPTTVTLVTDEGHLCTASHRPGHYFRTTSRCTRIPSISRSECRSR